MPCTLVDKPESSLLLSKVFLSTNWGKTSLVLVSTKVGLRFFTSTFFTCFTASFFLVLKRKKKRQIGIWHFTFATPTCLYKREQPSRNKIVLSLQFLQSLE